MITRRSFIKACLAFAAVPFVGLEEIAVEPEQLKDPEVHTSIYVVSWGYKGVSSVTIVKPFDQLKLRDGKIYSYKDLLRMK